jgi:hypothetical protein
MQFERPIFLFLLALLVPVVVLAWTSRKSEEAWKWWSSLVLRTLVVLALVVAIASRETVFTVCVSSAIDGLNSTCECEEDVKGESAVVSTCMQGRSSAAIDGDQRTLEVWSTTEIRKSACTSVFASPLMERESSSNERLAV